MIAVRKRDDAGDGGRSRLRPLLGLAALILLALLATAAVKSGRDLAAVRGRETELVAEIDATQTRIRELRQRVDQLGDDPLVLERLAREELGMVRPGDVVIVLPDEPAD